MFNRSEAKIGTINGSEGSNVPRVRFGLALVLFPLMFGIIDFSRALYAYHWVSYAAREGTRWASVRGTSCPGVPHPHAPRPAALMPNLRSEHRGARHVQRGVQRR